MRCALEFYLVLFMFITVAGAASPVEISVNPVFMVVENGQEFTVDIAIDPLNNSISAAQFNLIFDSSNLEVKNVNEGDLFRQNGANTIFNPGNLDNSDGNIINIWGLIITPGAYVITKGTLATITMYSKMAGISLFNLTNVIVSYPDSRVAEINISNGSASAIQSAENHPSSSSGSGGGGGGAGGGSAENYSNIVLREKYDLFIYKNLTTSYCYRNVDNPIVCVNITGNINGGETSTIVEVLKNTSSLVKAPADGLTFRNVNIWVGTYGFASSQNIQDAVITFRVDKSWIDENRIDPTSILLSRYSNGWSSMPTEKIGEDAYRVYYKAHTNSFSPFAIIAKKSDIQGYHGIPSMTDDIDSQQEEIIQNNELPVKENSDDLNNSLLIGVLIGIGLNLALIYKIRATRERYY
ncbi:MAG: PGF-pre-PGF domain-containing protein [Candidatus Methanoperedens sp.]|nr:PGF-pre-PGF domain-containing protein [Candidatus Methanoperedens sp.]MCZ7360456.1 PGF-pre-PGF domain-containing protein [Candidatus Methanoperedens sp.]HLB69581.1 PGF-pre-PGF domain-containing protein [Candidatus Methanoperedens sp.]